MISQLLEQDLVILEEMVSGLPAYLASNATYWTIDVATMPKLSIGGLLMRKHRLSKLREEFTEEQRHRFDGAVQQLQQALEDSVVRFEKRAHQELHARLSEWIGILKGFKINEPREYAARVDVRVVIHELVTSLSQKPYQLEQGLPEEIEALDRHLRTRFVPDEFVWHLIWREAYPEEVYWWLYGYVKQPHTQDRLL